MSFLAGFEPAIGCLHGGICPANRALTVHSTHLIAAHDAIESFLRAMTGIIACGAPCRIRTCDLGIRSPLLYPSELMARFLACLSRHCTPIVSLWLLSFYLSYSYLKVRVPSVLPLAQGTLYSIGKRSLLPTGIEHNMYTIM